MKNFCVLAYVDGRPVSAERLVASSAADAVRQVLLDRRLASWDVFEGRRKVAVVDHGFEPSPVSSLQCPQYLPLITCPRMHAEYARCSRS